MLAIFKQKTPINLLLLLVFGVLIKLPMFLHPHVPVARPADGKLFVYFLSFFESTGKSSPIIYPVLAFGLLFIQAILLTRFINSQRMMSKPNYLPGMAYLLITSLLPEWNFFSAALFINTILLFVLITLFKIYNQTSAKGAIYNIGLALGIAGFLFVSSITFIIWILLAMTVIRPFKLNEWILCLLGIATPSYFFGLYLFFTDQWSWKDIIPHISIALPVIKQSAWLLGSVFFLVLPFITGGYFVQHNHRKMLIHVRKSWSLLLLYLLVSLVLPFVNSSETFENWVMVMIPLAAFHACTYQYSTLRAYPLLLFWFSTAFVVAYQYYGPGW